MAVEEFKNYVKENMAEVERMITEFKALPWDVRIFFLSRKK